MIPGLKNGAESHGASSNASPTQNKGLDLHVDSSNASPAQNKDSDLHGATPKNHQQKNQRSMFKR